MPLYGFMVGIAKWFKAPGCDSGMRGFDPHYPPQLKIVDKAQCFVDVGEVAYLCVAVVDVANNDTTYTLVTQ